MDQIPQRESAEQANEHGWPFPDLIPPVMVNAYALDDTKGLHSLRTTVWSGAPGELAYLEPPGEPGTFWVRQTWANGVRCEPVDKANPMESDLMFVTEIKE